MRRRVVVTGLGVLAPNGTDIDSFSEALWNGRSGISRIACFDPSQHASQIAGQVPVDYLGEQQTQDPDDCLRFVRFAKEGAKQALHDAGMDGNGADSERYGVSIATAIGGTQMTAEHFADLTDEGLSPIDPSGAHPLLHRAATFNTASAAVAEDHRFEGICATLTTGCTGGNDAIGFATDAIRRGEADVMVTGASEAPLTPLAVASFDVIGALSVRNEAPQAASRPFDRGRDGFVIAEGAGVLVLEELEHARRRGARIYAEVRGFGSTSNAYHMTDLATHGEDLARSLKRALDDAKINPDELDYVNAHGSSTPQNDICETNAIREVLKDSAAGTPVSSIKSTIGHALAAANAIEAVASVLAIKEGVLPPTMNLEDPDEACDLDYVPGEARETHVGALASLSSGFGGIHSTLVLSRCS